MSLIALYFVPESPVWLVRKGFLDRADNALKWLRCNKNAVKTELNELIRRCENESTTTTENIFIACTKSSVLKPLIIINIFHIMMIFSGTYLIVFYAVDILADVGGSDVNTMKAAVYTAVVRLIFTISACFMLYHLNRRTLTILSGFGSGLSTTVLAIFTYVRLGQQKSSIDTVVSAICILCYIAANTNFMVMPGL